MRKIVVISIKPEFANLIFEGLKKIELRKSSPSVSTDDLVIVYSTSPEMAIIGICKVNKVIKATPNEIWSKYHEILGIDKTRFFQYYHDTNTAVGIFLDNTRRLKYKIPLNQIKAIFPFFSPPQTFKYYSRSFIKASISKE